MLSWAFPSLRYSPPVAMEGPSPFLLSCASSGLPLSGFPDSSFRLRYRVFLDDGGGFFSLENAVPL